MIRIVTIAMKMMNYHMIQGNYYLRDGKNTQLDGPDQGIPPSMPFTLCHLVANVQLC